MAEQELKRGLQSRHLAMIALGGSIGTGLFLASGGAIAEAGPGGAMLGYALISIMVYFLMTSLGEMSAYSPTTGSFCQYSGQYVDPAFGFAMGWNYWFNWAITIAVEVLAASLIMQFWFPGSPTIYWCIGFFLLVFSLNIVAVKYFGESEYWLSMIKVSAVVIFIIVGALTIFGMVGHSGTVGFHNWTIEGAPFHNGFLGFLGVFLIAGFSFQGTELIGVAAGEAKDPHKSIPKAIKSTFWRIVIFYICAIGVISFLIPYTDPNLANASSDVTLSPFTIIFKDAGFTFASTLMNAVILIAVLSACNASMYSATRTLWFMGKTKQAPKVFSKLSRSGIPYMALLASCLVGSMFLLTYKFNNGLIFLWLVNVSSLAGFIAWFGIALSHLRFRRAFVKQGRDLNDLPYRSKFFPYAPMIAMAFILIIVCGQQINSIVAGTLSWQQFLATYIGLLIFLIIGIVYKIKKKTKLVPLEDCPFHGRDELITPDPNEL
ncbi:amino acid permease [Francisellaceae bacterium]|nr:amino acid permease [Francisellaceae bacterium]